MPDDVGRRPPGRPRLNESDEPNQRIGFVADTELRERLQAEGARKNRSLSAETRARVDLSFALQDNVIGEVLRLAYGPENAALAVLLGEIARAGLPRGRWLEASPEGARQRRDVIRALSRVMERLAYSTTDPGLFSAGPDPEGLADGLLWDAGREVPDPEGAQGVWRWASEIRRHLGPLGPLLMKMHRTRQEWQQSSPAPAVVHGADNLNLLQAALEQVRVMLASTRLEAAAIEGQGGEVPRNKLARLQQVEEVLMALMINQDAERLRKAVAEAEEADAPEEADEAKPAGEAAD